MSPVDSTTWTTVTTTNSSWTLAESDTKDKWYEWAPYTWGNLFSTT